MRAVLPYFSRLGLGQKSDTLLLFEFSLLLVALYLQFLFIIFIK